MEDGFKFVQRHDVLVRPEYWLEIDEYKRGEEQFLLAHFRFAHCSPSVFKRALKEWHLFRQCVTAPLFCIGEKDDDLFLHFVSRVGYRFLRNVICENGIERRLFIHTV
jgi:hypothetical protein